MITGSCKTSFLAALKEAAKSGNVEQGKRLHSQVIQTGFESDRFVACSLVNMYAKFGLTSQATELFNSIDSPDAAAWNALLWGYVHNGENLLALHSLIRVSQPNAITYVAVLKACIHLASSRDMASLEIGMAVHAQVQGRSLESHLLVASSLVEMYSSCGRMVDARTVFEKLPSRDVVIWTSLMMGYVENGESEQALELFKDMDTEGCQANSRTFTALVKAFTILAEKEAQVFVDGEFVKPVSLERALAVQSRAAELNLLDMFLECSLLGLYTSSGSTRDAQRLFERMSERDSVCWSMLILGYTNSGQPAAARALFMQMLVEGCSPDVWTFVVVLKTCSSLIDVRLGEAVHEDILQLGLQRHAAVVSSLVDFYSRCGSMSEAEGAFGWRDCEDLVTWSSLIAGYSRQGNSRRALEVFELMQRDAGMKPDAVTCLSVLAACSRGGLVDAGRKVFTEMSSKLGVCPGIEHYHCMIDMLGRGNKVGEAVEMAEKMPFEASVVTWTSVLSSCSKWKRMDVGKIVFDKIVALDETLDSSYALMGSIYASVGEWEEKRKVDGMRREVYANKVNFH